MSKNQVLKGKAKETKNKPEGLSAVSKTRPIAAFASDLHFDERVPICRTEEPNWNKSQTNVVIELLKYVQSKNIPLFLVGDVVNRWNLAPEGISQLIGAFREHEAVVYALAGNHDLPYHNPHHLDKSAYYCLVEAGLIKHLNKFQGWIDLEGTGFTIFPFPYGSEVEPPTTNSLVTNVAIVHDYIWTKDTGHKDAAPEARVGSWLKKLKGYQLAFFGDNHTPFAYEGRETHIYNCGVLIRRRIDEEKVKPGFWVLYDDQTVKRKTLECTKSDKFLKVDNEKTDSTLNSLLDQFAAKLETSQLEAASFVDAVKAWIKQQKPPALIANAMMCSLGVDHAKRS